MNTVKANPARRLLSALLAAVLALSLAVPAAAADTLGGFLVTAQKTYEIAPGVTETELTLNTLQGDALNRAHMLEVQLAEPSVSVQAWHPESTDSGWVLQKPEKQAAAVEASLEDAHVVGLVNSNFYNMSDGEPIGALVVDGEVIAQPWSGWSYFVVHEDGTAEILDGSVPIPEDAAQAVSGKHRLVQDGEAQPLKETEKDSSVWYGGGEYRAPRTALGMRADGTLVLFETDGRQAAGSVGMTFTELAATMVSLGCVDAINLDGGGSSTFMTRRSGDEEITQRNTTSNSGGKTRALAATLMIVSSAYVETTPTPAPEGTDLSGLDVSGVGPVYVLRNETDGVCPTPVIRDGEKTLRLDGTDAVVTWENHQCFGNARVIVQGCGDYYGTVEIPYQLCPDKVRELRVGRVTSTTAAMRWEAVPLAEEYVVCQYDFQTNTLQELAKTSETSIELTGLRPLTSYSLCVRARAEADGVHVDSYSYDWIYLDTRSEASTEELVTNVTSPVSQTETIALQSADGGRFLFLPAFADLTKLPLRFAVKDGSEALKLRGSRGELPVQGTEAVVDLTKLSEPGADGSYELDVLIGNRSPMTVKILRSSVPALFLHSADPAKGRGYIDASKQNQATGAMRLISADGNAVYDGALTQIKARGNTTFSSAPKKSYQIKLENKADLIGIGEKGKTWVLLAGYGDATQLHDKTLKDLAARLGMPYVPKNDWVDLWYDGEYRGTYLLGEKNSVGSTGVDIADLEDAYEALNESYGKDAALLKGENRFGQEIQYTDGLSEPADLSGGWLLELNNTQYDEASGFKTAQGVGFNIKSPEWAGKDGVCYISEEWQEFENAVYAQDADGNYTGVNPETGKRYSDYADVSSLVQMVLIQEFSGNVDGFYSSLFFYQPAGGKLCAGPVWDLDNTFGTGWTSVISAENHFLRNRYLVKALLQIPDFQQALDAYYAETFRPEAAKLMELTAQHAAYLAPSIAMNGRLWPLVRLSNPGKEGHLWPEGTTYPDVIRDMQQWIQKKLAVMDTDHHCASAPDVTPPDAFPSDHPSQGRETSELITPTAPQKPNPPLNPETYDLPYTDAVKGRFYYPAVVWAHTNEITKGVTATQFGPDSSCTRAQIVTFLWRAAGTPEPKTGATAFRDVSDKAFYYKAMLWAVETGITKGTAVDAFSPNEPCTRGQAVTFLWRLAKEPQPGTDNPFTDVAAGRFYTQAVLWAVKEGVTNGVTLTTFAPDGTCTRAQIVTLLYRDFA